MTFNKLVNKVCGELPDDWRIEISLELAAGDATLLDPIGMEQVFASNRETLEETVLDALEWAKEHAE